jgi:hypothetical protein
VSGCLSVISVNKNTVDVLTTTLRNRIPPISAMLKYLIVTATTTIVNLVLVSTNTVQIANAAIVSAPSNLPSSQGQLIAKGERSTHINAQQQSDVREIHTTLTQFYRGFNQLDVDKMARVATPATTAEKNYLRSIFNKIKTANVDMSIEVKNIELVSLSDRTAVVSIEQLTKFRGPKGAASIKQSSSLSLVKSNGRWIVSDSSTIINSADRER